MPGCVTKKNTWPCIAEKQSQIDQAQSRIAELQKNNNEALDKGLKDAQAALTAAQNENNQLKQAAGDLKNQIAENVIEIGRHLAEAKQICTGTFQEWLQNNIEFTVSQANSYIRIYTKFD
jgi:TolA-binding protein